MFIVYLSTYLLYIYIYIYIYRVQTQKLKSLKQAIEVKEIEREIISNYKVEAIMERSAMKSEQALANIQKKRLKSTSIYIHISNPYLYINIYIEEYYESIYRDIYLILYLLYLYLSICIYIYIYSS